MEGNQQLPPDPESLALSESAEFMEIIRLARDEIRAGKGIPLDEVKQEFGHK